MRAPENQRINETIRKLMEFYENPLNEKIISEAEASAYGRKYNPRLWHYIFLHFFVCGPQNPPDKPENGISPKGSEDPKWNLLLHEMKAMDANEYIINLLDGKRGD